MKRFMALFSIGFTFVFLFNVVLATLGLAQDATPEQVPLWKSLLDMAVKSLLPAIWMAVGPMTVALVTSTVNRNAKKYVPREAQVIMSALFTAIVAGLTGGDIAGGAVQGAGSQVLAATPPEKLLTSAPEK